MKIKIWVEPNYSISNWYLELKQGLTTALNQKRMKADFCILEEPDTTIEHDAIVILAGETFEWHNKMLEFTNANKILTCVTACEYPMHSEITILTDYSQVCYDSLQYLADTGRKRIALFGVNPSSPHDYARLETYKQAIYDMDLGCTENDIFFTRGNITECVELFKQKVHKYNAVLCTNDLYAIAAMKGIKETGMRIPEDIYVMGSGNTLLSSLSNPPLSSATIDLSKVGYLTIGAINLLTNSDNGLIELNLKNKVEFFIRESTECKPFSNKYKHHANLSSSSSRFSSAKKGITSFEDSTFMELVNCEIFLKDIDKTDFEILMSIITNDCKKRNQLAELCFLSDTALDYRLRKLYKYFYVSTFSEFCEKVRSLFQFIDFSKIVPKE